MAQFHPDHDWLAEYAAGTLPDAYALCVAIHLHQCSQCRSTVKQLNHLGSTLFSDIEQAPVSDNLRDRVMANLGEDIAKPTTETAEAKSSQPGPCAIPAPLRKLTGDNLDDLKWHRLSKALSVTRLPFGDTQREVALHRIKPGGRVGKHSHRGQEITLVLTGSFSDQEGLYREGDFMVRTPDDTHRPMASGDKECICLSVLDAPISFTGLLRVINPFLRLYPR